MAREYVEVDLDGPEKEAILKYASSWITNAVTNGDLSNKRKKWIRFERYELSQVIGELSYHLNRCSSDNLLFFLDQLIDHLEYYEKGA